MKDESKISPVSAGGGLGAGLLLWSSAASLACAWGAAPVPQAALGCCLAQGLSAGPQHETAALPVLPPGPWATSAGGAGTVGCTEDARSHPALLCPEQSRYSILCLDWYIPITHLQEGSCSSLFLDVFLQADDLADLVTTENPQGSCL